MYGADLKYVRELFNKRYNIPDYQRGYRWRKEQAELLLNDLLQFVKNKPSNEEIYLLQPLVVNKKNDEEGVVYEVIDGQQRLTTIKLILCAFKKIYGDKSKFKDNLRKTYSLTYEVRPQTQSVIETPDRITDPKSNIDYYHIHEVYEYVKTWMDNIADDYDSFISVLLNNVCFIDYEISGDKKAEIELFTRLNVGKIPLTEAELIKALFLNKKNYGDNDDRVRYKISNEWNDIENRFQNDEFWYFIHNTDYDSPTRIDYLFEIIYSVGIFGLGSDPDSLKEKNVFPIFNYFKKIFDKGDKSVEDIWNEVRNYYLIFAEWYADYEIYHHVGYIIATTGNAKKFIDRYHLMNSLVSNWKSSRTKDGFKKLLEDYIADILRQGRESWLNKWADQVFEGKNEDDGNKIGKTQCNDLLLLHNIETVIKQNDDLANSRKYNLPVSNHFPFHLYKLEKWETEHIYPNAGDKIKDLETQKAVLVESRKIDAIKDDAELIKRIDAYLNRTKEDKDEFEDLYADVLDKTDSNYSDEDKNKISNYTLLDKTTNGEYGNLIFKIKRAYIMNKEKGIKAKYKPTANGENIEAYDQVNEVAFVLPVTKNVFAKFYTPNPGSLNAWTEHDADCYLADMKSKIGDFVDKAVNRINTEVKSLVSK